MNKTEAIKALKDKSDSVSQWIEIVADTDPCHKNHRIFVNVLRNCIGSFNNEFNKVNGFLAL